MLTALRTHKKRRARPRAPVSHYTEWSACGATSQYELRGSGIELPTIKDFPPAFGEPNPVEDTSSISKVYMKNTKRMKTKRDSCEEDLMVSELPHHVGGRARAGLRAGPGTSSLARKRPPPSPTTHFYLLASFFLSMVKLLHTAQEHDHCQLATFPANSLDTGDRNCKLPGTHKEIFQGLGLLGISTTQPLHPRF